MVSREQELNIMEETKRLVKLFLETNKSDIELSELTGISSSTVGRRLTNKEYIIRSFPNNGEEIYKQVIAKRQENLERAKAIGGQSSIFNNMQLRDKDGKFLSSIPKLRLELFSKDSKKQMQFLKHIALTFRVKLPLLVELFGIEESVLLDGLYTAPGFSYPSLNYLFYHDFIDQDIVKEKVITFYQKFLNALRSKDKEMQLSLIRFISDYDARELIEKRKTQKVLDDKDIEVIVKYQIKYALSSRDVAKIFEINHSHYLKRLSTYLKIKSELVQQYELLSTFNSSKYWSNNGKRI